MFLLFNLCSFLITGMKTSAVEDNVLRMNESGIPADVDRDYWESVGPAEDDDVLKVMF